VVVTRTPPLIFFEFFGFFPVHFPMLFSDTTFPRFQIELIFRSYIFRNTQNEILREGETDQKTKSETTIRLLNLTT
jgi:hypothetical protein